MFTHKLCGVRSHPYTAFIISRWGHESEGQTVP